MEAVKCFRATEQTVVKHNLEHPTVPITAVGILYDCKSHWDKKGDTWRSAVYQRALDLAIYDQTPRYRELAVADAEIAAFAKEHPGIEQPGIGLVQ